MKPKRILCALLLLLLTGCSVPSGDELLAAPKPSTTYQTLQAELEKLLASGVTYTAPMQGDNRSTVQLIDLNGDGVEEAISFFRGAAAATSNELKIYIYQKKQDAYVCTGMVEGKGLSILSVDYPVITPDGKRGMVAAFNVTGSVNAVTVCDFDENCAPGVLLETEYSAMELTDLTRDGANDLLLLASDADGTRVARLYEYANGRMNLAGQAATSAETVSVERIKSGRVADQLPVVLVEEKTAGGVGLMTDIFAYVDGALHNLALDGEDSASSGTYRPVSVFAADINGDGMIELPRAVLMAGYTDPAATDAIFMIDWYAYSASGAPVRVKTSYQNVADAWMLAIDDAWHDSITAAKSSENGTSAVQFFEFLGGGQRRPLFTIYCATGAARDFYVARQDMIQLGRTNKAAYFAKLEESASQSALRIDAEGLRSRFSLIAQDWNN